MRKRFVWFGVLYSMLFVLTGRPVLGQADDREQDKAAIRKNAQAFVEAFHQGDAKAVAAFWAPDGEYTGLMGRQVKGREAIEKEFAALFAENKGLKVRIDSKSLRFVTPDVAIEEGTTAVFPAEGAPPSRAHYNIVHVKKDGQWMLGSVRETAFTPPNNYENLRGLEWAIGDWEGEGEHGVTEQLSFSWTDTQNFILATFSTKNKDMSLGSATVWIGWDPTEKRIRSWMFDEAGGFGEGSWTQDGKKWVVKSASVLQDGKKMSATHVLTSDADTLTLQSKDRTIDGNSMPDTPEVKLKRVK
jgi:uncharacterized protein (TIGR02246 family)